MFAVAIVTIFRHIQGVRSKPLLMAETVAGFSQKRVAFVPQVPAASLPGQTPCPVLWCDKRLWAAVAALRRRTLWRFLLHGMVMGIIVSLMVLAVYPSVF